MRKIGLLLIFTLFATTVCAQDIRDMHSNKASKVKITDSGNYFVAANVEEALQEMMNGTAKYDFIEIGDASTYIYKDAAGNIDLVDAVTGSRILAQLVVGPSTSTDNAIARHDGTGGKTLQNSGVFIDDSNNLGVGTSTPDGDFEVEKTEAGGVINIIVDNLATGNTASHAQIYATTTTTGGDSSVILGITGQTNWSMGVDNDDTDSFKIGNNSTVGANTDMTITTLGATTFGGSVAATDLFSPQVSFTDENAAPDAVGEFKYDNTVAGLDDGAMCWYDDDEVQYVVSLPGLPSVDNYVVTYNSGNQEFEMQPGGSASVAGNDTEVQFNDAAAMGADADFTYNKTTNILTVAGGVNTGAAANPASTYFDSDAAGADKEVGITGYEYVDGGDGGENADWYVKAMQAGSEVQVLGFDESDDRLETTKAVLSTANIEGATLTEGGVAVYNDDEMDAFSEINAIVTDKTLVNEEDAVTWDALHTFSADIQLGQSDIKLDAALSGDETWSGITITGVSGVTTLAVGNLCYLNANDSRWELVDANLSDGYDKQLGICVLAGADGEATEMLIYGKIRSAAFPAFTVGSPLYMSETAGDMTLTQPTTTDAAIRILGAAITAEDLLFAPEYSYYTHI